jgi:hydrogenase expression/formation protein HypC
MCLTAPALVVSRTEATAVVEHDGRRRIASLLLVPEVRPGDWVVVGAGSVLRRLDPREAADLVDLITAARAATDDGPLVPKGATP